MKTTKNIGDDGEMVALNFLKKSGYQILEKNYRYRRSEIDVICQKSQVLVFVEVKFRKNNNFGYPENAVDEHKEEMILLGAENYILENDWKGEVRYDVVSITGNQVIHFEDAFG